MGDPGPGAASPAKMMNGTNEGGAAPERPSVSFNERDHGPGIFGRTPAEHATLHNPKSTIDVDHELLNVTERDLSNAEHTHLISDVLFHRLGRHLCDRVILSGFPAKLRYYNHGNYFPSDAFHDVNGHYVLDRALGVYRKEASSTAKKSFHSRVSLSQGAAEGRRAGADGEDAVGAIEKFSATSSSDDANVVQEDGSSEDYNSDAADSHLYLQWESNHLGRWVLHEILHGSHFDHNTGHFNWDEMSENDDRILAIIPDPLFLCFHETPRQIVSEAYWWSERKTFARGMVHVRFCANTFGASTFGGADVGGAGPPAGSFCVDSVEVQGAQQVRQPMGSRPAYREETARVFLPIEPCGWNSMVLDHFVAGAGAGGGTQVQVGAATVVDAEDKKHDTADAADEDESKKSKAKAAAAGGMINGNKDENEKVVEQAGGRVLGVEEKVVKEDGILAPPEDAVSNLHAVSNLLFTDMACVIVHPTRVKKRRRRTTASAASAGGEGADEHENDNKQKTKQGAEVDDEDDRGDLVVTLDDYKTSKRYSKEMGCHSFEICNLKWMVEKEEAARREQDVLAQVEKTIDHSLDETAANEQAFFGAAANVEKKHDVLAQVEKTIDHSLDETAANEQAFFGKAAANVDFSGKQRHSNAGDRLRLVLLETGGNLPACVPFTIRELVKRNRSFVLRSIEEFRMVGAVISTVDHAQKPLLDRMIALALHKRGETETTSTSSRKILTSATPTSGTDATTGELQGDRAAVDPHAATSSPPATTSTVLSDVKRAIKQAKTAAAGIQVDNLEKLRPSQMSLVQKLKHCDLIRAVHLSPPLWAFPYISLVGAPAQHFHCNGVYEKVRGLVKKEQLQNILHLYRRRIEHNDHGDAHERFLLVRLDPGNSVLQWRIQKHYSMEDEERLDAKLLQNLKALDPHPVGTGSASDGGPQIRAVTLLRKGKGSPMSRRQSRLSGRGSIVGDDGTIGLLDIAAAEVAEEDEAKGEEAGAASTSKDNYTERGEILFHATTPQGVELHGRLGLLQLTGAWASKGSEAELRQAAKRSSGSKVDDSPPGGFSPLDRTSGPRGPQSGVTTSRNPPVLLHFGHEISDDVVVEEVPLVPQGETSRNSGMSTSTSTAVRRKSSAELKLEQLKGLRTGPHNRKSTTPSASSAWFSAREGNPNRRRVFARYDSEDMLGYNMKVIGSGWCDGVYTLVSQWQDASREALLRHWGPDYEYILQLIRDKEKDLHHAAELKDAETPLLFIRDRVEGHDGVFYPINPLADDENGEYPRAVAAGAGAVDEDGNAQNEVEHGDHSQSLFFLHYDNNTFAGSWIVSRRDVSLSSSDEELVDFLKKHDDKLGVAVAVGSRGTTTGTGIRAKLPPPKGFNRLAGGGGIHIYSDSASGKKTMAGGGLGVAHARFSPPKTGGSRSPSSPGGSLSPRNEVLEATSTSLFETVGIVPDPFRYHWKDRHFFAGDADYAGHHYSWELENPEFDLCLGMWRDEHGKWFSTVTELVAVEDADGGG